MRLNTHLLLTLSLNGAITTPPIHLPGLDKECYLFYTNLKIVIGF